MAAFRTASTVVLMADTPSCFRPGFAGVDVEAAGAGDAAEGGPSESAASEARAPLLPAGVAQAEADSRSTKVAAAGTAQPPQRAAPPAAVMGAARPTAILACCIGQFCHAAVPRSGVPVPSPRF